MMTTLRLGSLGPQVQYLQRLLNKAARNDGATVLSYAAANRENRFGPYPLEEDGVFDDATERSLRAMQKRCHLGVDGIAGPRTWAALGWCIAREHNHLIPFGQKNGSSCWSAAATIILGNRSVGPGGAETEPTGGLVSNDIENTERFAASLGWRLMNHSPSVPELANLVNRTPAWVSGGGADWTHAVVIGAVYSDGDPRGDGTMFRIHDPWPVNRGRVYTTFANPLEVQCANGQEMTAYSIQRVMTP